MSNFLNNAVFAIAGATVLGLASLGFTATSAHAAPNQTETENQKSCPLISTTGHRIDVPAGTTITTTSPETGVSKKYKCNGKTGAWEQVPLMTPSTMPGVFDSRLLNNMQTAGFTTMTSGFNFSSVTTTSQR